MSDLESVMLSYATMVCDQSKRLGFDANNSSKFKTRRLETIAPFITSPQASKIWWELLEHHKVV